MEDNPRLIRNIVLRDVEIDALFGELQALAVFTAVTLSLAELPFRKHLD